MAKKGVLRKDYTKEVRDYYTGASVKDLAVRCGMTRVGMYLILKARNVKFRDERIKLKEEQIQDAINMYDSGCLMKEIANKYNVTVSLVSLVFKKAGVLTRKSGVSRQEAKNAYSLFKEDVKKVDDEKEEDDEIDVHEDNDEVEEKEVKTEKEKDLESIQKEVWEMEPEPSYNMFDESDSLFSMPSLLDSVALKIPYEN